MLWYLCEVQWSHDNNGQPYLPLSIQWQFLGHNLFTF